MWQKNLRLYCRGHTELRFNSPYISLSSAFVGGRLMHYYGRPMPPADGFVPIWQHVTRCRYWCSLYTSYFDYMSTNGMTYNLLPKAYLFLYLAEEHRLLHSYRPGSGETHPIEKVLTRHNQWSLIEMRGLWACYDISYYLQSFHDI